LQRCERLASACTVNVLQTMPGFGRHHDSRPMPD
jgi:hypothetical protein